MTQQSSEAFISERRAQSELRRALQQCVCMWCARVKRYKTTVYMTPALTVCTNCRKITQICMEFSLILILEYKYFKK